MDAALDDLRERGPCDLLSLSGSPVTVASLLASGWQNVGLLKPLSRVHQATALRQVARSRLARAPVVWRWASATFMYSSKERSPFRTLDALGGEVAVGAGTRVRITGDARGADMASLIDRLPYDGRIRHVRDEAYFSWRLGDPLSEYRFLYVGDDLLRGHLVLKCRGAGRRTSSSVYIVDCEAVDANVRGALLEAAAESGAFPELTIWSTANFVISLLHFPQCGWPIRA
jgi:hypothetical protein